MTKRLKILLLIILMVIAVMVIELGVLLLWHSSFFQKWLTQKKPSLEAATVADRHQLEHALEKYYEANGVYPKDDPKTFSSRVLVEALQGIKCDYPFTGRKLKVKNGEYYSGLGHPFFYRENRSKKVKTPDMHNPDSFDIWTKNRKGEEDGIRNWLE